MGQVYLALDAEGRQVAVKVVRDSLLDEDNFLDRFRREIDAAKRVQGAHTADLLDADADGDPPWLAIEFIDAPTLQRVVAENGPLNAERTAQMASEIASALVDIHVAGVVHRDLKPSNVLAGQYSFHVIDFGIARALDATGLTSTGYVTGSAGYMAPEQIDALPAGPAADVFALGAILFYAMTGRPVFGTGAPSAITHRVVFQEPDLTALGDGRLPDLMLACLRKDPKSRPTPGDILAWGEGADLPEAPEPVEDLHESVTLIRSEVEVGTSPTPERKTESTSAPRWRRRLAIGAAGMVVPLVIASSAAAWMLTRTARDRVETTSTARLPSASPPALLPTTPSLTPSASPRASTPTPTKPNTRRTEAPGTRQRAPLPSPPTERNSTPTASDGRIRPVNKFEIPPKGKGIDVCGSYVIANGGRIRYKACVHRSRDFLYGGMYIQNLSKTERITATYVWSDWTMPVDSPSRHARQENAWTGQFTISGGKDLYVIGGEVYSPSPLCAGFRGRMTGPDNRGGLAISTFTKLDNSECPPPRKWD